jgi:hypothetical protein
MNKLLLTSFDQIENQKERLLELLHSTSKEKLNLCMEGKWSINQVIAHLITAERLSLSYLQKKINSINEVADSGLWEELKMAFLIASQRLPGLKFKAPRVVIENTPAGVELNELKEQWHILRTELKTFLEIIPDGLEKRLIYKHVRAGRLNTIHALKFFREHIIHHTPQIKKLL